MILERGRPPEGRDEHTERKQNGGDRERKEEAK